MKKIFIALMLFLSAFALADYSFTKDGRNIKFADDELKFYEGDIVLNENQVKEMFKDYEIIKISRFDKNKKYEIKNSPFKSRKILLFNDTNRTFHGFEIYPISSRDMFEGKYGAIKSLITIYGKKNTRLKHEGGDEFEIVVK